MLLNIQFPIADLRIVLNDTHKLLQPQWPNPDMGSSLRYFGKVERRISGGIQQWGGEELYCNSKNALTIPYLTRQQVFFNDEVSTVFTCMYRRFFSDGRFTNKFEIGFKNDVEGLVRRENFPEVFKSTMDAFLHLKVKIKNPGNPDDQLHLHEAGVKLSRLYFQGSTTHDALSGMDIENNWWLKAGEPMVLIVHDELPDLKLPPHSRHIASYPEQGVELRYLWHRLREKTFIKVWLIGTDPSMKDPQVKNFQRQLRINLLRINAEKEVLRLVLNNISSGRINLESSEKNRRLINFYLENITAKILKRKRFGINQESILNEALASEHLANEGDFESLLKQLEPLQNAHINQNVKQVRPQLSPYYSVFISHSTIDREFSKKLHDQFKINGIRSWFDEDDTKAGVKLQPQIFKAIDDVDKVLVVLSDASITRDWIRMELFHARAREIKEGIEVLFPIRITSIENVRKWELIDADRGADLAREIREYFILDFTDWKNETFFVTQFARLLRDLMKPSANQPSRLDNL